MNIEKVWIWWVRNGTGFENLWCGTQLLIPPPLLQVIYSVLWASDCHFPRFLVTKNTENMCFYIHNPSEIRLNLWFSRKIINFDIFFLEIPTSDRGIVFLEGSWGSWGIWEELVCGTGVPKGPPVLGLFLLIFPVRREAPWSSRRQQLVRRAAPLVFKKSTVELEQRYHDELVWDSK